MGTVHGREGRGGVDGLLFVLPFFFEERVVGRWWCGSGEELEVFVVGLTVFSL